MFGFFVGTACLLGLVAVARRGPHRGRFGHGGWHQGRGLGVRFFMHRVLTRLDASPAQEKVIREAIHDLEAETVALRQEVRSTRSDVARALRAPELDKELLDRVFAKHDEVLEKLRGSLLDTADKVHTTLDEQQRQRLADLVEHGPTRFAAC